MIKKVTTRHNRMIYDLVFLGSTPGEVCEKYHIKSPTLTTLRRSPLWIEEEKKMRGECKEMVGKAGINDLLRPALLAKADAVAPTYKTKLEDGQVVESVNDIKVRDKAATDILNRLGVTDGELSLGEGQIMRVVIGGG